MDQLILIASMAIVGSLIGGLTNKIAITMLFKPYEAKYIFGMRVPLTPGVIPRRREEASTKLGDIIMGHLLTPEVFVDKIKSEKTKSFLLLFIDQQLETMEKEKWSTTYVLERIHPSLSEKILTGLNDEIHQHVKQYGESIYQQNIESLIPTDARHNIDEYVHSAHGLMIGKVRQYVLSEKGYQDIFTMIDEFIENRGRLANSIKMFFSKDNLTKRAQKEFLRLLEHPKMANILQSFIVSEVEALKRRDIDSFFSEEDKEKMLSGIGDYLESKIDLEAKLNIPISELNPKLFNSFKESGKEQLVDNVVVYMSRNLGKILDKLQLAQLIKHQIDNFELSKIEELVMSISAKEFKMITMLGFLLGGVIGIVQGIGVSIL